MATQGGIVRWTIEADSSGFNETLDQASQSVDNFSKKVKQADSQSTGGVFSNLVSSAKDATSQLGNIGSSLGHIAWGGLISGATAATGALTSLVSKGLQATDFLETSRVAMSGLTGSVEAGNKAMSIAANYWQNNPFQRLDVTNATKQLVQFGRTTSQLSGDLEILGNVSLSTQTPIDELARYYARVSASGRAMTIDLEMMSDRGIPIYRELAKALNTTTQGVRDMASEGKIDFETFRKAMEGAVDPTAMEEFDNTLSRQVDRIKGSVQILAGELAGYKIVNNELVISESGLEKAWMRLVKTMATELRSDSMKEAMANIGDSLAKVVDKITEFIPLVMNGLGKALDFVGNHSSALIPILGGALALFGRLGANLPGIGGLIAGVGNHFKDLTSNVLDFGKGHPIIASFIALFGAGFVSAMKNNEEFRNSIFELLNSLKDLATTIGEAVKPILQTLISSFKSLASSGAVTGILKGIVDALTGLVKALNSIPQPVLTGLITALMTMKLLSANPVMGAVTAIIMLVSAFKQLDEQFHIIDNIKNTLSDVWNNITRGVQEFWQNLQNTMANIGKTLTEPIKKGVESLIAVPRQLLVAGHNMVVGLVNGLVSGANTVRDFVVKIGNSIVSTFKRTLGIHSPSTVMYAMGQYVTLGLANGIEDNESVVQKAMDNLASDILSLSEKIISNQVDFKIIDPNGEYKAWQKVANMFTKGSQQYVTAIEKMEEARKQVNLRIIQLQEDYNDKLDETIDRIGSMYGTFEKVDLTGGMDAGEIISNLDQQVSKLQEWVSAQEIIAGLNLDPGFIEELEALGVDSVNELEAIANMTSSELSTLNDLWLKKQALANKEGVREMADLKNDTLKEIEGLKDGIDGATVDVQDVGGRLVANLSDGIYGSLPTLEESFGKLDDYMAKAAKELSKSASDAVSPGEAALDNIPDVPGTQDNLDKGTDEIAGSLEDMKNNLLGVIGGIIAGVAAWKFGLKLLKALGGTKLGGKVGELFSGIFGKKGEATKKSIEAVTESSSLAKNTTTIGENVTQVSQGMTKAQSVIKTIQQGAVAVIAIAGAIAAMAGALWITYNALKDIDFGMLAAQLTAMAVTVGAFGGLSYAAGKLDIKFKDNILPLIEIAGAIGTLAVAMAATNLLIPDGDALGALAAKLGVMGVATTAMGALAVIAGKFDESLTDGIVLLVGIAADIALLAAAMAVANLAIPNDLELFAQKLGVMGVVAGAMEVLCGIAGHFGEAMAGGILVMVGIVGDIAALALALGLVDAAIKSDFGTLAQKIGAIGLAVTEIGVLAGIIGAIFMTGIGAAAIIAGLGSLVVIAGDIVILANALREVNEKVPNNITRVKEKIDLIVDVCSYISSASLGNFFQNLGQAINMTAVAQLVDSYVFVADQLNRLQGIVLVPALIIKNIALIKSVMEQIGADGQDSLGSRIRDIAANFLEAMKNVAIGEIAQTYRNMAENLNYIQGIELNSDVILQKVELIKDVIERIGVTGEGSMYAKIRDIVANFLEAQKTTNIAAIVDTYANIADNLNKIQNIDVNYDAILGAIEKLNRVVELVGQPVTSKSGWTVLKDMIKTGWQVETTNNAKQILDTYSQTADILNRIKDVPADEEGVENKIYALNRIVESIVAMKGDGGVFGGIVNFFTGNPISVERIEEVLKILRKMGDIANTVNYIPDVDVDGLNRKMTAMQDVISKIGEIKDPGDISTKEWIVGMSQSIVNKLIEFGNTAGLIPNIDNSMVERVKTLRNAVWEACQINTDVGDMATKEWVVGMATSIAFKLAEFAQAIENVPKTEDRTGIIQNLLDSLNALTDGVVNTLNGKAEDLIPVGENMAEQFRVGLMNKEGDIYNTGGELQSKLWEALQSKMQDEFYQGSTMAEEFRKGIEQQVGSLYETGHSMQSSLWNGIQARMGDEYNQGQAMGNTFRQGLYDIDYANAGWWAVQGFINGVWSQNVYSTGWQVASNFLNGLRDRGRQGSPWKTTFQSGNWAVEGLIEGIKDSENALVNEATNLADEVIEALNMDDIKISPDLDADVTARGFATPTMDISDDEDSYRGGKRNVIIEQTNNNYTQYSLQAVNRDLAWEIAKI